MTSLSYVAASGSSTFTLLIPTLEPSLAGLMNRVIPVVYYRGRITGGIKHDIGWQVILRCHISLLRHLSMASAEARTPLPV